MSLRTSTHPHLRSPNILSPPTFSSLPLLADTRSLWVDRPTYPPLRTTRRQVVLLGAGMDTRPFRLGFSRYAHTVFEVDSDMAMLHAKHEALAKAGFRPRCAVKLVGAELSDARAVEGALSTAGFDPRVPTRWVVEGAQSHLAHDTRQALFTLAGSMGAVAGSGIAAPVIEPALAEWLHISALSSGMNVAAAAGGGGAGGAGGAADGGEESSDGGRILLPSAHALAPLEDVLTELRTAGWKNVRHQPLYQRQGAAHERSVLQGAHLAFGDADVLSAE